MADQHDPIDDWLGSKLAILKIGPRRSLLFYAAGAALGLAWPASPCSPPRAPR